MLAGECAFRWRGSLPHPTHPFEGDYGGGGVAVRMSSRACPGISFDTCEKNACRSEKKQSVHNFGKWLKMTVWQK